MKQATHKSSKSQWGWGVKRHSPLKKLGSKEHLDWLKIDLKI